MPTSHCVTSWLDLHAYHAVDLLQAGIITKAERSERFSLVEEGKSWRFDTNEHIFEQRFRNNVEFVIFSRAGDWGTPMQT